MLMSTRCQQRAPPDTGGQGRHEAGVNPSGARSAAVEATFDVSGGLASSEVQLTLPLASDCREGPPAEQSAAPSGGSPATLRETTSCTRP